MTSFKKLSVAMVQQAREATFLVVFGPIQELVVLLTLSNQLPVFIMH